MAILAAFAALSKGDRAALAEEGERLVRWVDEGAEAWDLRFEKP